MFYGYKIRLEPKGFEFTRYVSSKLLDLKEGRVERKEWVTEVV